MTIFEAAEYAEHDEVVFCRDRTSGLRAIIAIHDRTLGPAAGGCRMWPYASEADAVRDVLRLSRGMSFKNAMAGLPLGGGKSVILGDPHRDKTPELLRAFGRAVDRLDGRYVAAEDVGIGVEDVALMAQETRHVAGRAGGDAASGDPSPFTAYGVFVGIRAAVAHRLGRPSLEGVRVAVQGLGNVGSTLCRFLHGAGARLVVADLDPIAVEAAVAQFGAQVATPEKILEQEADVVSPCALGAVFDDASIPKLTASVVAGAANNQLAEARHGAALRDRGVLYAPDYVINAGGIINVSGELAGCYDRGRSLARIECIEDRLGEIFHEAEERGASTNEVADGMALRRLDAARERRER